MLETLFCYFQDRQDRISEVIVNLLPLCNFVLHSQLVLPLESIVYFVLMLFPEYSQKLLILELGIQPPRLLLLTVVGLPQLPILHYYGFVPPHPPNLVLDLLFLLGYLLQVEHQLLLSALELDQALVFALIDDHHPAPLVPLLSVVFLLIILFPWRCNL